jgi:hypothetical protein
MSRAPQRVGWRQAARTALFSGSAASILSGLALAFRGMRDEGSAAGPLNGPSQWVWGEREAYTKHATLRHTLLGYAIHHLSSVGWATLHERVFLMHAGRSDGVRTAVQALTTAAVAYFVDYHLTPRRFRPGFRKHLRPGSMFAVYAAFGAGLALARVIRQQRSSSL